MSYPTDIDVWTTKTDGDDYPEASHINDLQEAVEAVQTKVGADSSVVASSIDYKLTNTSSGHDHDGSDSKKVTATNLNPTGLTASQLLRVNSGGTAIESSGYTVTTLLGAVYPIGSIYTSVVSTNPATLFGFGTWTAFGAGRMLIGRNASDADFNTAEETGGSKTHTLTEAELATHTHIQNSHYHTIYGTGLGNGYPGLDEGTSATFNSNSTTATNQNTGSSTAFSIMNPYIVVYMWKRTA
jgi:hypothetical protein